MIDLYVKCSEKTFTSTASRLAYFEVEGIEGVANETRSQTQRYERRMTC